ncbi:unnamed protein product [Laminaria digitata]
MQQPPQGVECGGNMAGALCYPRPTEPYVQPPGGFGSGGKFAGVCPMQTDYYRQSQPLACADELAGTCPMQTGYTQPQPLACAENLAGVCPMPILSMPQHPAPMAYQGFTAYPLRMPQGQPSNMAYGGNFAGFSRPIEMPQWQQQHCFTGQGHAIGGGMRNNNYQYYP